MDPSTHGREQAKKDVAQIFNNLLRRSTSTNRNPAREHICEHPEILDHLMDGYGECEWRSVRCFEWCSCAEFVDS